jgi:hypothetical protein
MRNKQETKFFYRTIDAKGVETIRVDPLIRKKAALSGGKIKWNNNMYCEVKDKAVELNGK